MTKEQDFKVHFAGVLREVVDNGTKDKEAMWLLGSLASDLADDFKCPSWSTAKTVMGPKNYDLLLRTFQTQGNENLQEKRLKHAYAIQVLAASLVAMTQRNDPEMASGEVLLDQVIDRAAGFYRSNRPAKAN